MGCMVVAQSGNVMAWIRPTRIDTDLGHYLCKLHAVCLHLRRAFYSNEPRCYHWLGTLGGMMDRLYGFGTSSGALRHASQEWI